MKSAAVQIPLRSIRALAVANAKRPPVAAPLAPATRTSTGQLSNPLPLP